MPGETFLTLFAWGLPHSRRHLHNSIRVTVKKVNNVSPGTNIDGSNTVSNLMFSAFQYGVAERLAMSTVVIVALQAVGTAAGNMIAIHNVVAGSATVGLLGREGATLRKTFLPTIYYLLVIGVLGLVAIHLLGAR